MDHALIKMRSQMINPKYKFHGNTPVEIPGYEAPKGPSYPFPGIKANMSLDLNLVHDPKGEYTDEDTGEVFNWTEGIYYFSRLTFKNKDGELLTQSLRSQRLESGKPYDQLDESKGECVDVRLGLVSMLQIIAEVIQGTIKQEVEENESPNSNP